MANYEQHEVDPKVREYSRRRFLRNAGIGVAAVPLLGAIADMVGEPGAAAQRLPFASSAGTKNPFPTYPAYRFAFICHVTADPFFNACRSGATDASNLLGTSYTWGGSETDIVPEMVDAFNVAIDAKVNGIACCIVDPKAFNAVTDKALSAGIPVIAYNAESPTGAATMPWPISARTSSRPAWLSAENPHLRQEGRPGRWHDQRPRLAQRAAPHGRRRKRLQAGRHRLRPGRCRRDRRAGPGHHRGLVPWAPGGQVHVLQRRAATASPSRPASRSWAWPPRGSAALPLTSASPC